MGVYSSDEVLGTRGRGLADLRLGLTCLIFVAPLGSSSVVAEISFGGDFLGSKSLKRAS